MSRQAVGDIRLSGQGDWSAQSPRSAQITQGLFKAVMAEDVNELQRLLAQGGSWNALNAKGQTLEEVARERGRQKMVRYFERRSAVMAEQEKMRLSRIHERSLAKTLYASSSPIAVRHGRTLATGGGGGSSPLGRGRGRGRTRKHLAPSESAGGKSLAQMRSPGGGRLPQLFSTNPKWMNVSKPERWTPDQVLVLAHAAAGCCVCVFLCVCASLAEPLSCL